MDTENAIAIANYFVKKSLDTGQSLTPMKLVKLVYIAHGWYLVYNDGKPLISEAAEAWQYGPVIPSVYHAFKHYGKDQITEMRHTVELNKSGFGFRYPMVTDRNMTDFLDEVWDVYGGYSGIELSALTHQPKTPWETTWNQNKGSERRGAIIPNELIKEHYKGLRVTS